MNDNTSVGQRLQSLDISNEFDTYTMVIIHAGQITDAEGKTSDLDYVAGNTSGRTLEVTDPFGTQAKANALLAKLQNSRFQYQPYTAENALLDPSAEIGDGISMSDTFSAIYNRDTTFSSLMAAKLEAPTDEEIDHEFPYIPQSDRWYKRETAYTRTQLKINANEISAEVTRATAEEGRLSANINITAGNISAEVQRATAEEGRLSSLISQNATDITAKVSKTGGTNSSFAWSLQNDNFSLISNNKTVFKCTSSGVEVDGTITARFGYIGNGTSGFTITASAIYNGVTSITDTAHTGVYVGTDGIRLGKGVFSVTSAGKVTASNLNITGGSIVIKDGNGDEQFKVTSAGAVTAKNLTLTGGSINIKDKFKVTSAGKVTASDLNITGGTIKIQAEIDNQTKTVFSVNSSGNVSAVNMKLTGTLNIGGTNIKAEDLRFGAQKANDNYKGWDSAHTSTSSGGYCYTGATNGTSAYNTWGQAQTKNGGLGYIEASDVCARRALWIGDTRCYLGSIVVDGVGYACIRY